MSLSVEPESSLQDDVRTMIGSLDGFMNQLAPAEANFPMTAEEMAGDSTTVFMARDSDRQPIGMGCLKRHEGRVGEVKRMWADPSRRGEGIGASVLAAIVTKATSLGLRELVLETGTAEEYAPAWRLYERAGFEECQPVLDYPPSEHSRFYRKVL